MVYGGSLLKRKRIKRTYRENWNKSWRKRNVLWNQYWSPWILSWPSQVCEPQSPCLAELAAIGFLSFAFLKRLDLPTYYSLLLECDDDIPECSRALMLLKLKSHNQAVLYEEIEESSCLVLILLFRHKKQHSWASMFQSFWWKNTDVCSCFSPDRVFIWRKAFLFQTKVLG